MTSKDRGGAALWWTLLSQTPGVGAAGMLRLARVFGSAEAAVGAPVQELIARGQLKPEQAAHISKQSRSVSGLRSAIARWSREGIRLIAIEDDDYPRALLDLRSPPPLLYVQGELRREDASAVAIVGTRTPTSEGARSAAHIAHQFATRGFTIVSGLARGIDTAGHRGAMEAKEGRSLALLGCGLLRLYPPENAGLGAQLSTRGALIAEVPPEVGVDRRWLLARDRLQAALSRAVIVVQAHRECGSLVTARAAVRCGRRLFGAPWKEPPFAEGWKALQELGARPLTEQTDLDELAAELGQSPPALQSQLP